MPMHSFCKVAVGIEFATSDKTIPSLMMPVLVVSAPPMIACALIKPKMHCGEGWVVVRIDVGGGA